MKDSNAFTLRLATEDDIPALHALIEASVRGLQAGDYTQAQIEGALGTVLGLDTQLICDMAQGMKPRNLLLDRMSELKP
jgi:hypothetical protein